MIAAELVDHILSFLHSDEDYSSLETCSLSFPQIADRHLYSRITFYAPDPPTASRLPMTFDQVFVNSKGTYVVDPTQFSQLLVDRPHIANCVRVVRIIAASATPTDPGPNYMRGFCLRPATAPGPKVEPRALLPVISSILSNLSQIESIAFSSRSLLSWPTLDPAFCTALQNTIQLPSIKQVAVSEIKDFPLDTFHSCKNLRSLLIYGQCTAGVGSASPSSYPRLHSLRVDNEPALSRIVPWMRTDTLHTLSLCIHKRNGLPNFWTLIDACSSSLVSLELDHKYYDFPWDEIDFPELRLPLLKHIIFRSPVLMSIYHSFLPLFVSFLGSIQTLLSVSPVRLTLHLQFQRYTISTQPLVPNWSFIANVLVLPIFRHPIELYINQVGMDALGIDVPSSLEEHSDVRRMLTDGQLKIISDEEYNRNVDAR